MGARGPCPGPERVAIARTRSANCEAQCDLCVAMRAWSRLSGYEPRRGWERESGDELGLACAWCGGCACWWCGEWCEANGEDGE